MKKILTLGIVALVFITMSGCQFNLFAGFDKIEIPSASELSNKASSDPDGFLDDVNDYIESDSITEDDAGNIIDALEEIYVDDTNRPSGMSDDEWTQIQEEAAIFAGEIAISSDPETKELVDNIVASLTDLSAATTAEEILAGIFPANLSEDQFYSILDNLDTAAAAYGAFAASIDANDDGDADVDAALWMDSADAGNMVMYAAISIIASNIRALPAVTDIELYDFIYNGAPDIPGYDDATENPLDANPLSAILDFAGYGFN